MAGAAVKQLMGMAVIAILLNVASAGRTGPVAPLKAASSNHELASLPGFMIGCTPKILARDLILFCREPANAPMRIEACCGAVVGTVARPSCFCLVKQEPAFGMSALLNVTMMENMLSRCGASEYLSKTLYNRCDGSPPKEQAASSPDNESENQEADCPQTDPSSCSSYKVLSYVLLGVSAVLIVAVGSLIARRPTKTVYVPQIQLVTLSPTREEGAHADSIGPHNEAHTGLSDGDAFSTNREGIKFCDDDALSTNREERTEESTDDNALSTNREERTEESTDDDARSTNREERTEESTDDDALSTNREERRDELADDEERSPNREERRDELADDEERSPNREERRDELAVDEERSSDSEERRDELADDEERSPNREETSELSEDATSEDVLLDTRRIVTPNPWYFGCMWVNNSPPPRRK